MIKKIKKIKNYIYIYKMEYCNKCGYRHRHRQCHHNRSPRKENKYCEKHDYIIVGGGTAGLTLGYLLNKYHHDVTVLEAGPDKDNDPNITGFFPIGQLETNYRNDYFWLENESGTRSNQNHYSGGRLCGGGSSVNSAVWLRGNLKNYAKWGGLFADEVFLRNAFDSVENYVGVSQGTRGTGGPLPITQQTQVEPLADKWAEGLKGAYSNDYGINVPIVDDWNVVNGPAISTAGQSSLVGGSFTRASSSISLIKGTGSDLDIRKKATVTKILFKCKKAVGVEYIQDGKCKKMYARKKVIVCAGPRSSSILQYSGVGDQSYLSSLGVSPVIHNPEVGKNLENHREFFIKIACNPADNAIISDNSVPASVAFQNFSGWNGLPDPAGDPNEVAFSINPLNIAGAGATYLFGILGNPGSRGEVDILSNDPLAPICPVLNTFDDPEDIEKAKRLLEVMIKATEYIHDNIDPSYVVETDVSDLDKLVRENNDHPHQWNGTCRIGDVVDSNLHVMGAENLMVADLSVGISPFALATQAAAYMVGTVAYSIITGDLNPQF